MRPPAGRIARLLLAALLAAAAAGAPSAGAPECKRQSKDKETSADFICSAAVTVRLVSGCTVAVTERLVLPHAVNGSESRRLALPGVGSVTRLRFLQDNVARPVERRALGALGFDLRVSTLQSSRPVRVALSYTVRPGLFEAVPSCGSRTVPRRMVFLRWMHGWGARPIDELDVSFEAPGGRNLVVSKGEYRREKPTPGRVDVVKHDVPPKFPVDAWMSSNEKCAGSCSGPAPSFAPERSNSVRSPGPKPSSWIILVLVAAAIISLLVLVVMCCLPSNRPSSGPFARPSRRGRAERSRSPIRGGRVGSAAYALGLYSGGVDTGNENAGGRDGFAG